MDPIYRSDLRQLIEAGEDPCISIFLPTHRASADTLQDPVRLKNLIRDADGRLRLRQVAPKAADALLEPLRQLLDQHDFWQHQADGLSLFRSPKSFYKYRVGFGVPELAVVADRFHLKPLFPAIEASRRAYVVALNQDGVTVFEATPDRMTEITIPDMPASPQAEKSADLAEHQPRYHCIDSGAPGRRLAQFHGHSADEGDRKAAYLPYFHRVDEALRKALPEEPVPIVLTGGDYLSSLFRLASANPLLLKEGVQANPGGSTTESLHQKAWALAEAHFRRLRDEAADEYHRLWHTQRASKELPDTLKAANEGRVKTLFVAVGIQEWGHFDPSSAKVETGSQDAAADQDLLNLAALETFAAGGTVYAVPPGEVPGRGTLAAVYRY